MSGTHQLALSAPCTQLDRFLQAALQAYAHRELAEPAAVRAVQAGNGSDWNVVEIKRTGERGYRYIPREAFDQLKASWESIPLSLPNDNG